MFSLQKNENDFLIKSSSNVANAATSISNYLYNITIFSITP